MSTIKKRVNVSLSKDVESVLEKLARRDCVPRATKAAHLIEIALEFEEDQLWDKIAQERDKKDSRFISHKKAWA